MRRRTKSWLRQPRPIAPAVLAAVLLWAGATRTVALDWETAGAHATALLQRYIEIDTSNPPGDVTAAIEFLRHALAVGGIASETFESAPGRVNLLARLGGGHGPAVVLLHHVDVVPADPARWTVPPFAGELRDGFVWGRGALDDKGHGIAQLMTMLLLKRERVPLARDVVFLATADEEVGGALGAQWMVEHHWDRIDPWIVLNEGGFGGRGLFGVAGPSFLVSVAEKRVLWLRLIARGEGGHGSQPHDRNPNEILVRVLDRLLARPARYRMTPVVAEMLAALAGHADFPASLAMRRAGNPLLFPFVRRRMTENKAARAMLRDTLTVTTLQAGVKVNVIPPVAEATIDCRLLPDSDPARFLDGLRASIDDPRIEIEVLQQSDPGGTSPRDTAAYGALAAAIEAAHPGAVVAPLLTTGGTDSRFFRSRGVPAYGIIPVLLADDDLARFHGADERISVENLRQAAATTFEIVRRLLETPG
jgi:acetylornithine deacetylase/succinyl-diaminopimelate desuccinylase-like protein